MGYLTPDAPACQRDVWALFALIERGLAELIDELAVRTAEPSWAASLGESAAGCRALAGDLREQAGAPAVEALDDDEALRAFEAPLGEVLGSGHVPALLVTGYAVLGELGHLPARLLEDVAGPNARPLASRVAASQQHATLGRLFGIVQPPSAEREQLRRMLRHLNGALFGVFATWRQTFHVLGVDGEWVTEEARGTARAAAETLGLKVTRADQAVFGG